LFERRGRQLVANAAGRRMLHAAKVTLGELRAARLDLRELADGHRRPLRVASQCATNFQWLTDVARSLYQRLPGTELRFEVLPDDDPIAALLDDRLDVALVTKLTGDVNRVRLERLFDDELRAVVNTRHPLATRDRLTATDFADVHLVLCDSYDQTRTPIVPLPIPPGARPGRLTTIGLGPDMLIETVATSDAVTVIPSWIVTPYVVSHDVVSLAVGDPPQRRTWYSATLPERSEVVDTFVAAMHSHLADDVPRARASVLA
jgi:LysR family transcriptional regulator for metE and metH